MWMSGFYRVGSSKVGAGIFDMPDVEGRKKKKKDCRMQKLRIDQA